MSISKQSEKTRQLKEKLFREQVRVHDKLSQPEKKRASEYADGYREFLNRCRTERAAVRHFLSKATEQGFQDIDGGKVSGRKTAAPRLFRSMRGKALAMAIVGKRPLSDGIRLIASHIDSPRLDLKPNPLYEELGLALFKTQYYGGIKKYHWIARPLALCGSIVRSDGSVVELEIGLDLNEPVLTIPDLLPHLARRQMEQKASEFISGESMNLLAACAPYRDEHADDRVKLAVLQMLQQKYRITEEDFVSAEIQVVPAEPARDAGVDRSLIAGYGQDDRICAYSAFTALLAISNPEHSAVAIFYDKEEIGSEGNTSAQSRFLEMFLTDLLEATGVEASSRQLQKVFFNGKALSADVAAAIDPGYPDVFEKRNDAKLGYGIALKKYTGRGGKSMASDANAEYAGWVRRLFNTNRIVWQSAVLGKVDEGGGGTVAKYLANMGMEIIDCGPPILGMHSPLEVSSKDDLWMCQKAFQVFFKS